MVIRAVRVSSRRLALVSHRPFARRMTTIYVVPVDPTSPAASVDNLDAPELWSKIPHVESKPAKAGSTSLFFDTPSGGQNITALSSLGPSFAKKSTKEDAKRELVRVAVGTAVQHVKALGEGVNGRQVQVDVTRAGEYADAAAVAAHLAMYKFNLKTDPPSVFRPINSGSLLPPLQLAPLQDADNVKRAWDEGVVYAEAQNLARTLMEYPANMLTPTSFAERIQHEFDKLPENIASVIVHDEGEYSYLISTCCFIVGTRAHIRII